jgi:hypothetical protein
LKQLQLRGKKYSYELKERDRRHEDDYSYLPSQPNITPHYLLFGHSQEDVFKKVFQQILPRLK